MAADHMHSTILDQPHDFYCISGLFSPLFINLATFSTLVLLNFKSFRALFYVTPRWLYYPAFYYPALIVYPSIYSPPSLSSLPLFTSSAYNYNIITIINSHNTNESYETILLFVLWPSKQRTQYIYIVLAPGPHHHLTQK